MVLLHHKNEGGKLTRDNDWAEETRSDPRCAENKELRREVGKRKDVGPHRKIIDAFSDQKLDRVYTVQGRDIHFFVDMVRAVEPQDSRSKRPDSKCTRLERCH